MQDPRAKYKIFKQGTKCLNAEHEKRDDRHLNKVEAELACSILKAGKASDIDRAIAAASKKRKIAYNGGHQDDGKGIRFRMGQSVVSYLRWAFGERLVNINIYPKNNHPEPDDFAPNHFDNRKIAIVSAAIDDLKRFPIFERVIMSLLMDTGLRVSELSRIKISEINFPDQHISVNMTKVGRYKKVVFTARTKRLLELWITAGRSHPGEYLFSNKRGTHYTTTTFQSHCQEIGQALGFRMNPHAFRHSLGALWLGNGAQETEVLQQLGHRDRRMMEVYTHLSPGHLKETQANIYAKVKISA